MCNVLTVTAVQAQVSECEGMILQMPFSCTFKMIMIENCGGFVVVT